jgi:membrane fusion protein (multidrug efflux system)
VLQGAKSHFVWVVDNESKAHERVVETGEWHGDDWFITEGLKSGERVVVDGAIRVVADTPLKITGAPAAPASAPAAADASPGAPQDLAARESSQPVAK